MLTDCVCLCNCRSNSSQQTSHQIALPFPGVVPPPSVYRYGSKLLSEFPATKNENKLKIILIITIVVIIICMVSKQPSTNQPTNNVQCPSQMHHKRRTAVAAGQATARSSLSLLICLLFLFFRCLCIFR